MALKVISSDSSNVAFRNSLVALYKLKLERLHDEASRWRNPTPATKGHLDKVTAKVDLLTFLIKELEEIEFT